MVDIVPELWEKIEKEFGKAVAEDEGMQRILQKIERGEATYEDARRYAEIAGEHCSEALLDNLKKDVLPDGKMYYNIADRTVRPAMENLYELDSAVCRQIQEELNRQANIGLKPVTPSRDDNRISDIVDKLTKYDDFDEGKWLLKDPVTNYSQHIVDNSVKQNAEFQYRSGLQAKVVRDAAPGCCEWCTSKEGEYNYPKVPRDVYRRHENCNCLVSYTPGNGKYQDVHHKDTWYSTEEERQQAINQRIIDSERSKLETKFGKKGEELDEFLAKQPGKVELLKRAEQCKNEEDNYGIIANRIASGDLSLDYRHQKYLQHIENTAQYESATQGRKREQSYLTITEAEAQEIVWKYAGTGKMQITKNGYDNSSEYIYTDSYIGKVFEKGEWHNTRKVMICYNNKGTHIVPVTENGKYG